MLLEKKIKDNMGSGYLYLFKEDKKSSKPAIYLYVKRALDIAISLSGLIIVFPFLIILSIIIKLDSKGPVFFKQKRVGIHKTYFNILKFRSMKTDAPKDIPTHLFEKPEQYLTRIGKFLRKTSLDELPQIINILLGKMSFIGPRPALWNQYDLIAERDKYGANDILPGLTGWAQINGRDELSIEDKARLDGEYARNMNFKFDIKCFFHTLVYVFRGYGIIEGRTGDPEKAEADITIINNM